MSDDRVEMTTDMLAAFARAVEVCLGDTSGTSDDDFVRVLAAIRDCRAGLADLARVLETQLAEKRGPGAFTTPGMGEVVIRRSMKRTGWRHDQMIPAVIARIMDEPETLYDPETAELLPYAQLGHNVAARLRECVSFGAGKITGLKALGLDPSDFCDEQDQAMSVQIPRTT